MGLNSKTSMIVLLYRNNIISSVTDGLSQTPFCFPVGAQCLILSAPRAEACGPRRSFIVSTHIVWFKRDLRVTDHVPLADAAARGKVLPLYVIEPELWAQPDVSSRHWQFIRASLLDLSHSLARRGAPLVIRRGEIIEVLSQLKRELGEVTLWSHEETGNAWTYARDLRVAGWCREQGIAWHEAPSHGVRRRLADRDHWASARDAIMSAPVLSAPVQLQTVTIQSQPLPAIEDPIFGAVTPCVQAGGRQEGKRVLQTFLERRSRDYMRSISKPGISARHCSRLSAHIAYGTLSVREIEQATARRVLLLKDFAEAQRDTPDEADSRAAMAWVRQLNAFRSRLAWRCHFVQKLEQQPRLEHECMHPAFEGMREQDFRQDFFDAWCAGQTGYPLIDACMRSLHVNGWITFRMRAMLVSFASYHLWLDWRRTAPYMARLFTDYEPGIHYSQFQMQSGVTGINAIRIYNPIKQSRDQDPEGRFIRRYVPEIAHLPDELVHEPWLLGDPIKDYPAPIVDHAEAVRATRARMAVYRQEEGFKEQAREVYRKLGSRNRPPSRRGKRRGNQKAGADAPQLELDMG